MTTVDLEEIARAARAKTPVPQFKEVFVFLCQRKQDSKPWPLVYEERARAEAAPARVSPVFSVWLPVNPDLVAREKILP